MRLCPAAGDLRFGFFELVCDVLQAVVDAVLLALLQVLQQNARQMRHWVGDGRVRARAKVERGSITQVQHHKIGCTNSSPFAAYEIASRAAGNGGPPSPPAQVLNAHVHIPLYHVAVKQDSQFMRWVCITSSNLHIFYACAQD